jgi:hypothetical protein
MTEFNGYIHQVVKYSLNDSSSAWSPIVIGTIHKCSFEGLVVDQCNRSMIYATPRDEIVRIKQFDRYTEVIIRSKTGSDSGNNAAHLNIPYRIGFDSKNNLYVSDRHNDRVQKLVFDGGDLFC